jgi:O-antigen/teichoic acid export membrane protein
MDQGDVVEGTVARHRGRTTSTGGQYAARVRSGVITLFGFGLTVLLLAVASLAAIPAMVAADGEVAWGAIVLGQSIGSIGGVVAGYGWGLFGPARVANASPTVRRLEYLESVVARIILMLPVSVIAAALASVLAPGWPMFAAVGALSGASVGLTANWYFVGVARPYIMLVVETIPRAAGTAAGIVLMDLGHSAIAGPAGMLFGMLGGFAISTIWVFWSTTREGAGRVRPRPLRVVLSSHRHGVASNLGLAAYWAAPIVIVSVVAPAVQPAFALADKVQKQINVALAPASAVLQGWVPRAAGSARVRRTRVALTLSAGFAIVLGAGTAAVSPTLLDWLGHGEISVSWAVIVLMAACISVTFFERVIETAALAPFERLDVVARAVIVSSVVGLPLVALGAVFHGTVGALTGVLAGLLVCVAIEYIEYARTVKRLGHDMNQQLRVPHPR